jgi:cysteine sulfinate desulfinase/cysteine desulfurase-like protein
MSTPFIYRKTARRAITVDAVGKPRTRRGGYSEVVVYLDNAASTRPAPEVLAATRAVEEAFFANPASAHGLGAAAARALEAARAEVAAALGAETSEIVFTGGGTEANALGLLGAARAARGRHVVVSGLEHPAVARTAERLAAEGYELSVIEPTPAGVVRAADVVAATRADTAVVALMLVNNELGTLQPVAEVAQALAAAPSRGPRRPHLHVDAVQAFGLMRVRPRALGADTVALSAHKLHGPKGVGALWVRPGARLEPLWDGGRQERGLRSGTENVAGCVGLGRAAALAVAAQEAGAPAPIERERDLGADPGRAPHRDGRAARAAHRLAGLPGLPRRAAPPRARGARRLCLGRLGLRLAHARPERRAQGHRRRRSHGRAALLAGPHDHTRRRRSRRGGAARRRPGDLSARAHLMK